MIHQSTITGDL